MAKKLPSTLLIRHALLMASTLLVTSPPAIAGEPIVVDTTTEPVAQGQFEATWPSLEQYQTPDWYRDAKFGIWAHWGPQCEPEHGDWYARNLYFQDTGKPYQTHLEEYGHPSISGFKDIIHLWKAENWDPEKLVGLYKDAGAKFFVAMANHHDNFDNWESKYQPWNAVNMGPQKDLIGGWAKAARDNGLPFGVTVHAAHAWSWYEITQGSDKTGDKAGVPYDGKLTKADGKGLWWDGFDPQDLYEQRHTPSPGYDNRNTIFGRWRWNNGVSTPDAAYCEKFYNRTVDLINKYHPDLLYFDDTVLPLYPISDAGLKIAAHFYNSNAQWHNGQNQGVLLGKDLDEAQKKAITWDVERGASPKIEPLPWQSETCIGGWHYDRAIYDKHGYKSAATVIRTLANVISKNGTFLLNVPVRADGTIDDQEIAIVKEVGRWMKANGEAVYATRPWKVAGEGPSIDKPVAINAQGFNENRIKLDVRDIRYTTKNNTLYAFVLGAPTAPVVLNRLGKSAGLLVGEITSVDLVGGDEKVEWDRSDKALTIQPPKAKLFEEATVYKIALTAPPDSGAPAPDQNTTPVHDPKVDVGGMMSGEATHADGKSTAKNVLSAKDPIAAIKQTTQGKPNTLATDGDFGGPDGTDETAGAAVDGDGNTKYFNRSVDGSNPPGVNSGFVVTPTAGATVVTGVQFAAANDLPDRDPIAATIEGSNDPDAAAENGNGFKSIYSGPTGLETDPDRSKPGQIISFKNTEAFKTYRVLITKIRGNAETGSTQYSEVSLIGTTASH